MTTLAGLTTDDALVLFDDANPTVAKFVPITGVGGDLLGIDFRPANGLLYGVSTTNEIYTINPATGAASLASTLSEPFKASAVSGFDFNPVADRLRLVGDNNQDFRINVETGAVTVDGNLAFAANDANASQDANITAAAYTNAFAGTTSTQLYNIDGLLDILTLQNPPNDGIQQTIGALGADFEAIAGFDIISSPAGDNIPFAASNSTLYRIDLSSGASTPIGSIGSGNLSLKGLTQAPAVPASNFFVDTQAIALTDSNTLVSFNLDSPDLTTEIPLSGLNGTLLGIDFRPATGELYGITTNNTLYTINPTTGAASVASTLSIPFDGGSISGFDFNPVADRLRLVGDTDTDFRINVETGGVTVDGDLAFAAGDVGAGLNPSVTASGYTNSFAGTTSTQLYNIDGLQDRLVLQNPPNDGVLATVGDLGVDIDATAGFDIARNSGGENVGVVASNGTLYTVDLLTGQAFKVSEIGGDRDNYIGLTVVPGNGQFNGRLDGGGGAFDATQYLASNPDLIIAFGADTVAAENHFTAFGQAENRATDLFDELRYLASNPDLITVFGADTAAATQHFINFGSAEGRVSNSFNPVAYVNAFPDLRRAFGADFVAATQHYVQFGFAEGRVF